MQNVYHSLRLTLTFEPALVSPDHVLERQKKKAKHLIIVSLQNRTTDRDPSASVISGHEIQKAAESVPSVVNGPP